MGCFFSFQTIGSVLIWRQSETLAERPVKMRNGMKTHFSADLRYRITGLGKQFCRNVQPFIQQSLPESSSVELLGNPHQLPFADKKAFSDIFCGKLTHKARIYQIIQSGYPIDISVDTRHLHSEPVRH